MRTALLALALLSLNCSSSKAVQEADHHGASGAALSDDAAPEDGTVPEVAVLGNRRDGGLLSVTFRSATPISLSDTASARLETPRGAIEAALAGAPLVTAEGEMAVVSASYVLQGSDYLTANLSGRASTIVLVVGGVPKAYPVVRGDVLE